MSDDALIRRGNLRALGKSASELAKDLGSGYSYWAAMLADNSRKAFGEKVARRIEGQYNLPRGCMDLLGGVDRRTATPNSATVGKEIEPVQPSPTIGATIVQLGALLATLNTMGRSSIGHLIAQVVNSPDLATEAAAAADAIAQSQRLKISDKKAQESFGKSHRKPVESDFHPIDES